MQRATRSIIALRGTDNRSKGVDNRSKGTDNRRKGTGNRSKGTDNRSKGTGLSCGAEACLELHDQHGVVEDDAADVLLRRSRPLPVAPSGSNRDAIHSDSQSRADVGATATRVCGSAGSRGRSIWQSRGRWEEALWRRLRVCVCVCVRAQTRVCGCVRARVRAHI